MLRSWKSHAERDRRQFGKREYLVQRKGAMVSHLTSWIGGWALLALGVLASIRLGVEGQLAHHGGGNFDLEGSRAFAGHLGTTESGPQSSTSAPPASANMERIVSPTLGPFKPSPEIKFPEPPRPMVPPVYGEVKTPAVSSSSDAGDSGIADVLTPPHQYYPKPASGYEYEPPLSFGMPPSGGLHPHRPLPPPPLLFGGAKDEDYYLSYDGPEEDDHAYQYLPPPSRLHHRQPPKMSKPSDESKADSSDGSDAGLLSNKAGKAKAWKTLVAALTTLVPIGLFLAALPPNYVTITNSTSARVGKSEAGVAEERRLDDPEEEFPVLGLMARYGIAALADPECESRIFCEMSRMGKDEAGNVVQRVFWRIVNDAPDVLTEMVGLRKLFKAARTDSCPTFKCKNTREDVDFD